jgi:hypothetical protein
MTKSTARFSPSAAKASATGPVKSPLGDATTSLQATYRSGVTPAPAGRRKRIPTRAKPRNPSRKKARVHISGADASATPISRSINPSRSGCASVSGLAVAKHLADCRGPASIPYPMERLHSADWLSPLDPYLSAATWQSGQSPVSSTVRWSRAKPRRSPRLLVAAAIRLSSASTTAPH